MSYTIHEGDAERQRLLAECLNPLTVPVLDRIPREGARRILDLGCGQGNTSRFLAAQFPDAVVTGLENDANLVAYARAQSGNERVQFVHENAAAVPFGD